MNESATRDVEQVQTAILAIIADMVQDWDTQVEGGLGQSTRLVGDLGFSSVDIISLIVSIEEHFGTRNLGFADLLMHDGRYVEDLGVGELAGFVASRLVRGTQ
jgi:acyl carrier protein